MKPRGQRTLEGFYPPPPEMPVETSPLVRRDGPATAAASAAAMRGSKRLGDLQREALELVRQHPGSTAHELDRLRPSGDSVRIARRLSELRNSHLIYTSGTKPDPVTGRACQRWWATSDAPRGG